MEQKLALVTLLVDDYDKAIDFYVTKLNFTLIEDTVMSDTKRWVVVSPKGSGCGLLLAKASTDEQKACIGNQSGGRVFLFLYTDNFERDFKSLTKHNVKIIRAPKNEPYGTVAVFSDLYGNLWDLIQPSK